MQQPGMSRILGRKKGRSQSGFKGRGNANAVAVLEEKFEKGMAAGAWVI